jgi:tetratricopeptide (TPR) repeat protein
MLACLALKEKNWPEAVADLERAAAVAPLDLSVRQAHAYVLRKTGRHDQAQNERDAILKLDPTNAFVRSEQWFAETTDVRSGPLSSQTTVADDTSAMARLDSACVYHPQGYVELSTEYMRLSAWKEAGAIVDRGIAVARSSGQTPYPMLLYYRAYAAGQDEDNETAMRLLNQARLEELAIDIFPFRYEDTLALSYARKLDPRDTKATVLLADLLYSRGRRDEAIGLWREAVKVDGSHFFALRDLGLALLVAQEQKEGLDLLTRASVARPDHDATTLLLADINARVGNADDARKAIERALKASPGRDLLVQKLAAVEAQLGNEARALDLLTSHKFEATHQTYSLLHLYRGVRLMMALGAYRKGDLQDALVHAHAAAQPPSSLGIDDYATVKSSRLLMFEALLHQAAGNVAEARSAWEAAA